MADTDNPTASLVLAYRNLREAIQDKEAKHKEEVAEMRGELDMISERLLEVCNETGAESIKTTAGTVSRRIQTRYWTTDWESMHEFIRENDALYLLEQRISNNNMKQFLEENPDKLPIGLQADRKYIVHVRKPTAK